jgi:hypothetical protein
MIVTAGTLTTIGLASTVVDANGNVVVAGDAYTYPAQVKLFEGVYEAFLLQGIACTFYFGWREPPRQRRSPRIVWRPGSPTGDLGGLQAPRNNGPGTPATRPVWNLDETWTVEITAHDPDYAEVEIRQMAAVRTLFDSFWREVREAGGRNVRHVSSGYVVDRANERRHGATIRSVGTILAAVPDRDTNQAAPPPTLSAGVETTLLDVTDTETVPP